MQPENYNQEENQVTQTKQLHQVTPLSKYLAMALFIILPFIGGWIGYMFAPEKVVEKEVIKEVVTSTSSNPASIRTTDNTELDVGEDITSSPCPFDNPPEQGLNEFYSRGDTVCYQGKLADVDSDSFARIYVHPYDYIATFGTSSERVARFVHDDQGFYVDGRRVFSRESGDYEVLDNHYFRIKDTVYAEKGAGLQREGGYVETIAFADIDSFTALGKDYAKDKNRVYYNGQYISSDTSSFRVDEYPYDEGEYYPSDSLTLGLDQNAVYYKGEKLNGIDPTSFTVADRALYIADEDTLLIRRASSCHSYSFVEGTQSDLDNYVPGC